MTNIFVNAYEKTLQLGLQQFLENSLLFVSCRVRDKLAAKERSSETMLLNVSLRKLKLYRLDRNGSVHTIGKSYRHA